MKLIFRYYMDYRDSKIARMETESGIPLNIFADDGSDRTLSDGTECDLQVFGMGNGIRVFSSEEEYSAEETQFAPISMIPSGTFPSENGEESPHIIFSGKAANVEYDPNADQNQPNYCITIDTYDLSFCLFVKYEGQIEKGNIVSGEAWLYTDIK